MGAIVEDTKELLKGLRIKISEDGSKEEKGDTGEDICVDKVRVTLSSPQDYLHCLDCFDKIADESDVYDALYHFRKQTSSFTMAKAEKMRSVKRKILITKMFSIRLTGVRLLVVLIIFSFRPDSIYGSFQVFFTG